MSYVRSSSGRKTPYEKKYSRKNKEQEEWVLEKTALDSAAEEVSDISVILEQLEARSEEGRLCALRNLIRTARNIKDKEKSLQTLQDNQKLITEFLIYFIRSSPSVALLAFDALEVLALIYGLDEEFLSAVLKPVSDIALTTGPKILEIEQQQVVGAALRTLGTICFFCCDDNDTIVDIIHDIDGVICVEPKNASQPVVAAALGAWELIHTFTDFSDEYYARMTSSIWSHLKSSKSDVDTRIAAGRALAFSFSRISEPGDTILDHREWIADSERLQDVINECAFGTSHPKHDRSKEQPIFKDLASYMLDGEELKTETMTINGIKVVFESWKILTRLTNVRRILESGLQQHLLSNSILPDILNYEVPVKEERRRKSAADKKYQRRLATLADKEKSLRKSGPSRKEQDY